MNRRIRLAESLIDRDYKLLRLDLASTSKGTPIEYMGIMQDMRTGENIYFNADLEGGVKSIERTYRELKGTPLRMWFPQLNFNKYYYYSLNDRVLRTELDVVR